MASEQDRLLVDPLIEEIANRHQRSTAQVTLRWAIQRGTIPIPKTQSVDHLRENIDLFDFALSEEEMQTISSLNQNRRFNDPGVFGESAFNTFYPIFD
jgi:D-xylose reductase